MVKSYQAPTRVYEHSFEFCMKVSGDGVYNKLRCNDVRLYRPMIYDFRHVNWCLRWWPVM